MEPERGGQAQHTGADGRFSLIVDMIRPDGFSSWSGNTSAVGIAAPDFGPIRIAPVPGHETPDTAREIRLARAASLEATVLDAGGAPIDRARVRLRAKGYALAGMEGGFLFGRDWTAEQHTGPDGTCRLTGLPPEVALEVTILAQGWSFHREPSPIALAPGEETMRVWKLGGALLRGLLLDETGAAVSGQHIWLSREGLAGTASDRAAYFNSSDEGKVTRRARTDTDGLFLMKDVGPGAWWIGPAAEMRSGTPAQEGVSTLATIVVIEPDESEREVVLHTHRGLTIEGVVIAHDGKPVPGAILFARSLEARGGFFNTRSDEQGRFAIGPFSPGSFEIRASGSGDQGPSQPITAQAGDMNVVMRLTRGMTLNLQANEAESNEPCGAKFLVWGPHPTEGLMTTTGGTTVRQIQGLRPGAYDITATTKNGSVGIVRNIAVSAESQSVDVKIPVKPGATLKILYEGPQSFGRFRVFDGETCVAGDGLQSGTTSVRVVPVGRLRVEVGMGEVPVREQWVVTAPGKRLEVSFRFE